MKTGSWKVYNTNHMIIGGLVVMSEEFFSGYI